MPTAFAFDPTKVNTDALHWIRWRVGDTKVGRPLAAQDTIIALLATRSLLANSNPVTNAAAVRATAIDVCKGIIATLSQDTELTLTGDGGLTKSLASQEMRKVLSELQRDTAKAGAAPRFLNPGSYDPGFIADVDQLP